MNQTEPKRSQRGCLVQSYAKSLVPFPEGGDPPLLRLHQTTWGKWQMLVAPWARDQLIAANQNRVDFQEFGWWVLEHREVFSGPSIIISHVPLELSDKEIH